MGNIFIFGVLYHEQSSVEIRGIFITALNILAYLHFLATD